MRLVAIFWRLIWSGSGCPKSLVRLLQPLDFALELVDVFGVFIA